MISIRPLRNKDIPAMATMAEDPAIESLTIFVNAKRDGESKESIFRQLVEVHKNGWFCSYVILKDNKPVGYLNSDCREATPDHYMLGCWVGASYRGEGIASQALRQLIDKIAKEDHRYNVQSVFTAAVAPNNLASLGLIRSLGFQEESLESSESAMPVQGFILQPKYEAHPA